MIAQEQVVLAIFAVSFILILSESVHRTIAAWFGSVVLLIYGHSTGVFTLAHDSSLEHTMLGWIEFEVIGLLLGMMVFAAILELCGFFEFIAIKAAKMSGGDPWKLIVLLGTFTTLISLVIDNVTAIIIIAPVTLKICNKMEINPIPPLLAEAILSDTGGVASMVGDPPNVMIAAEAANLDLESTFGFNGFLMKLGILTLIAWVATLGYLRWYYRDWIHSKPANVEYLLEEDEWDSVDDKQLMYTTLAILLLTVVMFSAKEFLGLAIEIHAIALSGAGLALVAARPQDHELRGGFMHLVTEKVEWSALLFWQCGIPRGSGGLDIRQLRQRSGDARSCNHLGISDRERSHRQHSFHSGDDSSHRQHRRGQPRTRHSTSVLGSGDGGWLRGQRNSNRIQRQCDDSRNQRERPSADHHRRMGEGRSAGDVDHLYSRHSIHDRIPRYSVQYSLMNH